MKIILHQEHAGQSEIHGGGAYRGTGSNARIPEKQNKELLQRYDYLRQNNLKFFPGMKKCWLFSAKGK